MKVKTMGVLAAFALAVLPLGLAATASAASANGFTIPDEPIVVSDHYKLHMPAVSDHETTRMTDAGGAAKAPDGSVVFAAAIVDKPACSRPADPLGSDQAQPTTAPSGHSRDAVFVCTARGDGSWETNADGGPHRSDPQKVGKM